MKESRENLHHCKENILQEISAVGFQRRRVLILFRRFGMKYLCRLQPALHFNTLQQLQCVKFVNTVNSIVTARGMTVSDMHIVFTRQVRKPEWQYRVTGIPFRQVRDHADCGVVSCCHMFPGLGMFIYCASAVNTMQGFHLLNLFYRV